MSEQLVALRWWTVPRPTNVIGVVALVDRDHGLWKAYIGTGEGQNADHDARAIALWGAKLDQAEAQTFAGERFADLTYFP